MQIQVQQKTGTKLTIDCILNCYHSMVQDLSNSAFKRAVFSSFYSSQCVFSLSRPRNGNRREPLTAADAEKSSSCKIGLKLNLTLRAAASDGIISRSVCVCVAGGDNVLCKTLWTDLMVLGSKKCSSSGRPHRHSPQYSSCADLVIFLSVSARPLFSTSTKIGKKMYLCLLVVPHSITQNSISTFYFKRKCSFYLPM